MTVLAVVLATVVVITGLVLLGTAMSHLYLTRAVHGSTPVFRIEKDGGQEAVQVRYLTWDVRKRAESSFRPEGSGFGFDGRELRGVLTFSVPDNCADRRIRWEIRIDSDRVGGGSLRWLHTYTVTTNFALDRTPDSVGITMYWDGGEARCPSFSAEWKDARVERMPIG